jgi:polyferredoxin
MEKPPRRRPNLLRWPWIAVFSGLLIMAGGAIAGSEIGPSVGTSVAIGFLLLCVGASLLFADE